MMKKKDDGVSSRRLTDMTTTKMKNNDDDDDDDAMFRVGAVFASADVFGVPELMLCFASLRRRLRIGGRELHYLC